MRQASPELAIVPAEPKHSRIILDFIHRLAEYEKLSDEVKAKQGDIDEHLFGPKPAAEAVIAFLGEQPVGFALFFTNFSTFLGRPGLYLEDLFVDCHHRGLGIGKALLRALAKKAVERGCGRLEWAVLDWNQPAIDFYRSLGAKPQDEWITYRLTGQALEALSAGRSPQQNL